MPDEEQEQELKKLLDTSSPDYVWVNAAEIQNKGANKNYKISETAMWTL